MTSRLVTGRIVWAEIADANGNRKLRPAVIVAPDDRISAGVPFDVVAITSRVPERLPDDHILLPWHSQGHPRTGLNRRSAAICTWLTQVKDSDVQGLAGVVPAPVMATILAKLAAAIPPPPSKDIPPEGVPG